MGCAPNLVLHPAWVLGSLLKVIGLSGCRPDDADRIVLPLRIGFQTEDSLEDWGGWATWLGDSLAMSGIKINCAVPRPHHFWLKLGCQGTMSYSQKG